MVRNLETHNASEDLTADVGGYAKAGRILLEFPEDFFTQDGINHALTVLDTGLERAHQLQNGQSPWMTPAGRKCCASGRGALGLRTAAGSGRLCGRAPRHSPTEYRCSWTTRTGRAARSSP